MTRDEPNEGETTPTNSDGEAKAVVQRYIEEIVNEKQYQVAEEVFAEDYTRHDEQYTPAEFVERIQTFEAFPDLELTIGEITAEGDLVTVRATARGTHEREFGGIEPTVSPVDGRDAGHNDALRRKRTDRGVVDPLGRVRLMCQLGAIPDEAVKTTSLMRLREWLVRDSPPRRIPHS